MFLFVLIYKYIFFINIFFYYVSGGLTTFKYYWKFYSKLVQLNKLDGVFKMRKGLVHRDYWRVFYYRYSTKYLDVAYIKEHFFWKVFLNTSRYNPRWNFFGRRSHNVNYKGRCWNFDGFFHLKRRYRIMARRRYKRVMYKLFLKTKKSYRFLFFSFFKLYLNCFISQRNFWFLFKKHLLFFFFNLFIALKKWSFKFKLYFKSFLKKKSKISLRNKTILLKKSGFLKIEKNVSLMFFNKWSMTYHTKNVQLNFLISSGVFLVPPFFFNFRFPNPWFRDLKFTQLYLGYVLSV